jgi:hypothetical protein
MFEGAGGVADVGNMSRDSQRLKPPEPDFQT